MKEEIVYAAEKLVKDLEAEFSVEKDEYKKRLLRTICNIGYLLDSELRYFCWADELEESREDFFIQRLVRKRKGDNHYMHEDKEAVTVARHTTKEKPNLYYEALRGIPPYYTPEELIRLEEIKDKERFDRNFPQTRITRIWDWLTEPKVSYLAILAMMIGMFAGQFSIQLLKWWSK